MLLKHKSNPNRSLKAVMECSRSDLQPGKLAQLFCSGVKAVILADDPRVARLWEGLLGGHYGCEIASDRALPWEDSIVNVARNHRSGDMALGDMFRFAPGSYAHIARKVRVFPSPNSHTMQVVPDIWSGDQRVVVPDDILRTTWELMSDIHKSTVTNASDARPDAVAVELLKYPDSTFDLEKTFALLADAAGGWTRLGQKLDSYKGMANGMFDAKVVRDLFAWASLIPGAGHLLHKLNCSLKKFGQKDVSGNVRLIGNPHTDHSKVLTALASDRDVITTEIHDGENWLELPFSHDTLAIFPSHKVDRSLGITPTLHRIGFVGERRCQKTSKSNITLSLGIVD